MSTSGKKLAHLIRTDTEVRRAVIDLISENTDISLGIESGYDGESVRVSAEVSLSYYDPNTVAGEKPEVIGCLSEHDST